MHLEFQWVFRMIGRLWHRQQRCITHGMLSLHERSHGYSGHVRVEHALRITGHLSWMMTLIRLRAGLTSVYIWAVPNTVKHPGKHDGIPFPPHKRVSSSNRRAFLRPNSDIIIIKGWWSLNVWNRETQLAWVCVCVCVIVVVWLYTLSSTRCVWVQVCGSDQVWGQPAINLRKARRPRTPRARHITTAAWLTSTIHPTTPERHGNTPTLVNFNYSNTY